MSSTPDGTVDEVLEWVDDDPQRAQTALEAENCKDNPRSTLVSRLEAIANQQEDASMTPNTTTADESGTVADDERDEALAEQEELAPGQPTEIELRTSDAGLTVTPIVIRDPDVEVDEDAGLMPREPGRNPDAPPPGDSVWGARRFGEDAAEQYEGEPITGALVETLQAAIASNGCVILINGEPFAFNDNMTAALKGIVDKAVVGLSL